MYITFICQWYFRNTNEYQFNVNLICILVFSTGFGYSVCLLTSSLNSPTEFWFQILFASAYLFCKSFGFKEIVHPKSYKHTEQGTVRAKPVIYLIKHISCWLNREIFHIDYWAIIHLVTCSIVTSSVTNHNYWENAHFHCKFQHRNASLYKLT